MTDGAGDGAPLPARASLDQLERDLALTDITRRFVATWWRLRGTATIPDGNGFNPLRFGQVLAWVSLIDLPTPEDAVYRLGARAIEEGLGYRLKGLRLLDLVSEAERPVRAWRYAQMIGRPCGFYFRAEVVAANGLVIPTETTLLPVGPRPGEPGGRLLACGAPLGNFERVGAYSGPWQRLAETFAFVDLGAGTPESGFPP